MKRLRHHFIIAAIAIIGITSFSSCEKDAEDIDLIKINSDETTVIARFIVPEGNTVDKITISGVVYGYNEEDINAVTIKSFSIPGKNITGNKVEIDTALKSAGEPVPGAEVYIEQESKVDPVVKVVSDADSGFTIIIDWVLDPGVYTIKCFANGSRGGYAVGGFNPA